MRTHFYSTTLFAFFLSMVFTNIVNAQTYCNPSYSNGCPSWKITNVAIAQAGFNDSSFATCTQTDKTSTMINMNIASSYDISVATTD